MQALLDGTMLVHKPLFPVRNLVGEQVFAQAWEAQMDTLMLSDTLGGSAFMHAIDQREASVAATFICWLGTHVGSNFLDKADSLSIVADSIFPYPVDAYRATWAVQNKRAVGINHGLRSIEFICGNPDDTSRGIAPELTQADYDVVDAMAAWVGSSDGRVFVDDCRAQIKTIEKDQKSQDLTAFVSSVSNRSKTRQCY